MSNMDNTHIDIPRRGTSAKFAQHILKVDYNELDVYIEDTKSGYQKIYINILSRLFSEEYKIEDVNPVGPREDVIKLCRDKQKKITRPSLFFIDGDLFLLKGEESPLPKGVFRLPRYSIENILFDEKSILEYLDEEHETKLHDEIKSEINFQEWIDKNKEPLINLFINYALVQKHKIFSIKTIKHKVSSFTEEESEYVNYDLIKIKIEECKKLIVKKIGEENYNKEFDMARKNITKVDCELLCHVSGKDYILPLMRRLFKRVLSKDIATTNFALRLARKCPTDIISECKKHIIHPSK
ncbi:DUF4435 domain-containing protein [Vibrio vulnificus]|uniref:DUF4435 domain-containing protein n=1 Tax=Vibrio vulnificus TaxID=672 RepID=UPI001CDC4198|nr:DUF4435 domain-containing protein [Vibrio vulnificus]MCA3913082.1 DUF4435 domain-containing protein [Vibrio vulnificus]